MIDRAKPVLRVFARAETRRPMVIFGGMTLSMLLGIAFQSVMADRLGTGPEADIFYLGTVVPTVAATIILGSAPNALMRVAVSRSTSLRPNRNNVLLWRLAVITLGLSAVMFVVGLGLLADILPFLSSSERGQVGEFLLLTLPVPTIALLAALGSVRALAARRFVIGTYGSAANGIGLLAVALLLTVFHRLSSGYLAIAVELRLCYTTHVSLERVASN